MEKEWQTIDSAPKDGTRILAASKDRFGEWHISCSFWDGNWYCESEIRWLGDDGAVHDTWHPTHWMPLPSPPV